ncbi:Origin recognition complex subunit 2 [Oopsacas minuta]|uniref:Origin recognition complex subunit 2 n=1 Tax=Oopsacas minuta TaxID=111878 RepID=A0AAV7JVD3_9METZ|nr:Origin recognition complex subunit 2 [Oopsacas minuta]
MISTFLIYPTIYLNNVFVIIIISTDLSGNLELSSGCGRYSYSVVPVYLQTARHKITDQEPNRRGVNLICEKIDSTLNLTSPPLPVSSNIIFTSPSVFNTPKHPQLLIDKIDFESPLAPQSPTDRDKKLSYNSDRIKSPIKSMRPPGKLTRNKRITKGTRPAKKQPKETKKGVKIKHRDFDMDSSPGSESDLESKLNSYFDSTSKCCVTSSNTLADMSRPKLSHQEVHNILSSAPSPPLQLIRDNLFNTHKMKFQSWTEILALGMNIIVYGFGSKRNLLETYRTDHLSNSYHLVINGFFPTLSIKSILTQISSDVIGSNKTFKSIPDECSYIINEFHTRDDLADLYIIVHNICSTGLQIGQAQITLSQLATCKRIHFLASIDLFKGPLMWDQGILSRYKWVWQYCPTYAPYTEEISYENSFFVQQSGSVALSALVHVMASLTPNARNIFKLLTQQQNDTGPGKKYSAAGVPFYDLYAMCRANFLVNSEQTLRSQLTEFKDHKLVKGKRGGDGVEYLRVTVDQSTIKLYFEEHFE